MKPSKIFLLLAVVAFAGAFFTSQSAYAQTSTLKFNAEGKFKIVQLTDIHWKWQSKIRHRRRTYGRGTRCRETRPCGGDG